MLTDDDWDGIQLIRGYYCLERSGTDGRLYTETLTEKLLTGTLT